MRFLCAVPQAATECGLVVGHLFREQVIGSSILPTPTIRRRDPNWQRCPSQKRKVEGSNPSIGTERPGIRALAGSEIERSSNPNRNAMSGTRYVVVVEFGIHNSLRCCAPSGV